MVTQFIDAYVRYGIKVGLAESEHICVSNTVGAHMRQILFGTKPLSETMLAYC